MNPAFRRRRHARLALLLCCLALAFSLCALISRDARAEAEEQDPSQNGMAYARWQRVLGARPEISAPSGAIAVTCAYLGSFAHRESAWQVQLKALSRTYLVPQALAAKWGLSKSGPLVAAGQASPMNALCPAPPSLQKPEWSPSFLSSEEVRKLGHAGLEAPQGASETTIALDVSAKALAGANGLCDDKQGSLQSVFSRRRAAQLEYCKTLVENEFDRGMKRCLGVVNGALNRIFDRRFDPAKTEAVVWGKDDPTQSYCGSLLMLGGSRFDQLLSRSFTCGSAFQTLQTSSFKTEQRALATAIQGVFGATAARVEPVLRKVHYECKEAPPAPGAVN